MKRFKVLASLMIAALAFAFTVQPAQAQLRAGDTSFSLSGGGASDKSFDGTTVAADARFGWMVTNEIELSLQQGVSYAHADSGDSFSGSTAIGADLVFAFGKAQIFTGPYVGTEYGDQTSAFAGWELRPVLWLSDSVGLYARGAYQFSSEDFSGLRGAKSDGAFVYSVGVEVKL